MTTTKDIRLTLPTRLVGATSEVRARMPPSPSLSACISTMTYLMVTTMTSDHRTSERMPSTVPLVTSSPPACTASRKAYRGLVPMSP